MNLSFLLVFLSIFLSYFPSYAKEIDGAFKPLKVERVVDGDTIVASGQKIRLWGIDTPEKGQLFYSTATLYLKSILSEGGLACKFVEFDRYKRSVMHCEINGADIGSMMVRMGMARDFEKYSGGFYSEEQKEAQKHRRGIWGGAKSE